MRRDEADALGHSFAHAWKGIRDSIHGERNLRIEVAVAVLALAMSLGLRLPAGEVAIVVVCIALVLAAELTNTALEAMVNLVSPGFHPLARRAKDAAAGACLVAAGGSVVVGLLLFLPRILNLILR